MRNSHTLKCVLAGKKQEMQTYITLLRGENVGGKHSLPMKSLTAILEAHSCDNVKTYIQSGNVVFRHDKLEEKRFRRDIATSIKEAHGFPAMHYADVET